MIQRIASKKTHLVRITISLSENGFKCVAILVDALQRELTYKVKKNNVHEGVTVRKEELMKAHRAETSDFGIYYYTYCYKIDMPDAVEMLEEAVLQEFNKMKNQIEIMQNAITSGCVHSNIETEVICS
jgi:hypothetical protein